jgi:hypothetical protein
LFLQLNLFAVEHRISEAKKVKLNVKERLEGGKTKEQ